MKKDTNIPQKRIQYRHGVHADIDVYDSLSDVYLGKLVNIHTEGLMIVGDRPLVEDKLYKLDIHLRESLGNCTSIHLGVDCLWTRNANYNGKHWAGFSVIDLSPQAAADINLLISHFSEEETE